MGLRYASIWVARADLVLVDDGLDRRDRWGFEGSRTNDGVGPVEEEGAVGGKGSWDGVEEVQRRRRREGEQEGGSKSCRRVVELFGPKTKALQRRLRWAGRRRTT